MTQATEQFNASVAPIANVAVQGQIGPNIQGSGTAQFNVGAPTFYLYFAQAGNSSVSYGVNGGYPSTPLQPYVWTPINGASSVNVAYSPNGGDLKLVWAQ
ncbi:MAG TPA: hypothetical protein VLK84_22930 [Longimicrobium sp.]|nr:hypothetical protein [Longimicrobium sp.]